jgi:hypothetical protein
VQAPPLPPLAGAAASGVLVGVASVVLVALGMQACEALRDSPSCGGPGLVMLVVVVVALVALGRALLAFVRVPDPLLVSFLGVVLSLVVVLAGFVEQTFSVWMWLVMPALAAATFALCHVVLVAAAHDPDDEA